MLLEVLWEDDGLTPGELAGRLQIAVPTVVKSVNRMAATGLLARRPDPADARLVRVYLTEHGRAVRGAIERERDDLERRAVATLTGAEHTAVLSALRKMITQFEITEPPPPGPPG
jgi:DNA-binding MarR family transcriptional regulator